MPATEIDRKISKPKSHKGRKFLADREPKIHENDKHTLIFKGAHTSDIVNSFLTDLASLKSPFARKLQRKNRILPFEDASFIENQCNKYDCSLFVTGMHSKKRPNNIVIGRLHDHEILDMHELGIERYVSLKSLSVKLSYGMKPVLIFSGEAFDESEENQRLKSILIDLFRGPKVSRVNTSGIEYVIHFIMPTPEKLIMRVQTISLKSLKKPTDNSITSEDQTTLEPLQTPWGSYVNIELNEAAPQVDFVIRRRQMPSEDKWKRAMRVPAEVRRKKDKATKNTSMDMYGNRVGQIHLQRETALDVMRPGMSMRTALTGHVKRGFERQQNSNDKLNVKGVQKRRMNNGDVSEEPKSAKRRKAE
ncbi:unnamed protein product [Rodentolepis nana]|uniref:Ribosome production factor 2 homolog n=1 Tax=Rodentolepis nana TaxID=102285 RepID=A0A0R3TY91_RODNA|nr:unnamed protein product [Rodentolepis nana]